MPLTLTDAEARQFRTASRVLMSPLGHDTLDAWGAAVNDALCELFGAQRAALVLPRATHVHFTLRDFDDASVEPYRHVVTAAGPGANAYADPLLDRAMASLQQAGVRAWTTELAEELSGVPTRTIPFFQDVMYPGGLAHMAVMGAAHDQGVALCAVYHDGPGADPRGPGRLGLIELLAPSFEAGVRTLDRLDAVRGALDTLLDDTAEAVLVCDGAGREIHRSRALETLLRAEPEPAVLLAAMLELASTAAGLAPGVRPPRDPVVVTRAHRYTLAAGLVRPGVFGPGRAVVVTARRAAPLLPPPESLMERFGLTRREAEVAIMLARGRSNAEIADALHRSPHTIRHHAEHIFHKLGIHTRKALALELLGGHATPASG